VSGLARGIDTAAHKAAIEAGGRTIGVIGTPIDVCYPKENQRLQTEIAINHLLISQFAPGTPARKGNFPTRNRLMALLSDATVIVEAQDGSGTTHQGWEALRLARPLWILQSAANNPDLKWPQEFLRYGAQVLSDDSFDDLEDSLPSAALTSSDASLSF
jgi:DNA processing protein